jgi:hypothetical protein
MVATATPISTRSTTNAADAITSARVALSLIPMMLSVARIPIPTQDRGTIKLPGGKGGPKAKRAPSDYARG